MSLLAVTAKLIKPCLHQMPMTSKILRLGALRFEGTEPQFTVLPEPPNYPMGCEVEPDCYGGSRARPICKKLKLKTFVRAKQPSKSIWDTVPEIGPCRTDQSYSLENPPRFDELYYRMSDKAKRKYQMTWAQTTPPRNKRYCCDLNKIIPPPFIKRPKKEKAKKELRSACECNETKFEFICKKPPVKQGKCPQIMLEKCLTGRRPPSCDRGNKIIDCTKKCCPYPSYSECCQEKPARIPSRPPECFCLVPPPMCIVYREMRRLKTMAKRDDPAPVVCG